MTPPSISMRLLEGEPRPALDGWLRRRLLQRLAPLRHGALQLDDAWGSQRLGAPADAAPVRLRVDDARFYRALALGGSVGAGDAYGDGLWHSDDLVGLVRLLLRNRDLLDAMEAGWAQPRCAPGTRCATTPVPVRVATSPPTTTWATTSSACSCPPT